MTGGLLLLGGTYSLGFAVYHCLFWKVFRWQEDFRSLSRINRSITQVINVMLTYVLFVFAYVSFFHWQDLISTDLGRVILTCISVFWFLRAAGQMVFFKRTNWVSRLFFVVFLLGGVIYLIPLVL